MKNTYYNPSINDLPITWYLIDAQGQTLGKVAAKAAMILMGKHTAAYVPHLDNGHRVVVINAAHLAIDPKKADGKIYWHHTGYPGGIRHKTLTQVMATKPEEAVRTAVRGMLPKNRLGRESLGKLYIYAEADHAQTAQQPELISL
jgi:large subunit ribosomal protein L13